MHRVKDEALLLNNDYRPLQVMTRKRALTMRYLGKVHPVTESGSVVRLNYLVRRPLPNHPFEFPTRKGVIMRDGHRCGYCGETHGDMTIDHIQPKSRGGKHAWDNLVCCCYRCNNVKGDRTPREANMELHITPRKPKGYPVLPYATLVQARQHDEWEEFIAPYLPRER